MKKTITILSMATLLLALNSTSCKKYDDDKGIKLRTVQKRLTNKSWFLDYAHPLTNEITQLNGLDFPKQLFFSFENKNDPNKIFINQSSPNFLWNFNSEKHISFESGFPTLNENLSAIYNNGLTLVELSKDNLTLQTSIRKDTLGTENSIITMTLKYSSYE